MRKRTRKSDKGRVAGTKPIVAIVTINQDPAADWVQELKDSAYEVIIESGDQFFRSASSNRVETALLYFAKAPIQQVTDLIAQGKQANEHLPIICVGSVSQVEDVVTLMKAGSYDVLEEPIVWPKLVASVGHAVENFRLTQRVSVLESQVQWEGRFDNIVGSSPAMQEIYHMVKTVAKSNATILILGESGTGKELVANAIHNHSGRDPKRFVDINCGAIPRELLENELFGHERGAFTGADRQYIGSVERASGGTLFLDEIGELDVNLQVKLLRLLQEKSFQRIGGTSKIDVDIRVIAATNRDLQAEVEKGNFREELYYRLNVVPITIPPLRSRREDVPLLAKHFLDKFAAENNRRFKDFSSQALQALVNYDWPGNVRELENTIERVVVLHDDTKVKPLHLPRFIQKSERSVKSRVDADMTLDPYQKVVPLAIVEQNAIESTLAKCNGDVVLAAKKLQIGQATLYRKLKRYGIRH